MVEKFEKKFLGTWWDKEEQDKDLGKQIEVEEQERICRSKRKIGKQIEVKEGETINRSRRR